MAIEPADPLHDAALALIGAGLDAETVKKALKPVRLRWIGSVYIRSKDPFIDDEIQERLSRGEHPSKIARETGLHRTTVIRRRASRWL